MGTIFEAEHTLIGNRVAVKMLHEPFAASREPVQRLYREARATGAIGHPNIIQIYDVGETVEGIPFLVMELLEGESLGEHLERKGPLTLGMMLDISIQMLSALHAAHNAGIIHRDLKSDNIFMTRSEISNGLAIKLLDFGVSKFLTPEQEALRLTQTGSVLGTPYYMSPEQASGRKDLDHRVDLYASGVIMYEMLTETVPHNATNYNALLLQITTSDVRSFAWKRPNLPGRLEQAVLKALSRDRDLRWKSASDFMQVLAEIRDSLSHELLCQQPRREVYSADDTDIYSTYDFKKTVADRADRTPMEVSSTFPTEARGMTRRAASAWVAVVGGLILGLLFLYLGMNDGTKPKDLSLAPKESVVKRAGAMARQSSPPTQVDLAASAAGESVDSGIKDSKDDAIDPSIVLYSERKPEVEEVKREKKKHGVGGKKRERLPKKRKPSGNSTKSRKKEPAHPSGKISIDQPMDNPF